MSPKVLVTSGRRLRMMRAVTARIRFGRSAAAYEEAGECPRPASFLSGGAASAARDAPPSQARLPAW